MYQNVNLGTLFDLIFNAFMFERWGSASNSTKVSSVKSWPTPLIELDILPPFELSMVYPNFIGVSLNLFLYLSSVFVFVGDDSWKLYPIYLD